MFNGRVSSHQNKKDRNKVLYTMTKGYIHRLENHICRFTNNPIVNLISKQSENDDNKDQAMEYFFISFYYLLLNRQIKNVERRLDLLDNQVMKKGFYYIMNIVKLGFGEVLKIITKSDRNTLPFVVACVLIGFIEECVNYM